MVALHRFYRAKWFRLIHGRASNTLLVKIQPEAITMHSEKWNGLSVAILLTGCFTAGAQTPAVLLHTESQTAGITNLPYSAKATFSSVQKLADGTTITRSESIREARDSEGRTMRESKPGPGSSREGVPDEQTVVYDVVARTNIRWSSFSKQARLRHMWDNESAVAKHPAVTTAAQSTPPDALPRNERHIDHLGIKMIAGLPVEGTRTTRTIPANKVGNDKPIVSVTEIWKSRELDLVLLQTEDDPRWGLRTTEVTEVERTEPDSSLFHPPADYTIKDDSPAASTDTGH